MGCAEVTDSTWNYLKSEMAACVFKVFFVFFFIHSRFSILRQCEAPVLQWLRCSFAVFWHQPPGHCGQQSEEGNGFSASLYSHSFLLYPMVTYLISAIPSDIACFLKRIPYDCAIYIYLQVIIYCSDCPFVSTVENWDPGLLPEHKNPAHWL